MKDRMTSTWFHSFCFLTPFCFFRFFFFVFFFGLFFLLSRFPHSSISFPHVQPFCQLSPLNDWFLFHPHMHLHTCLLHQNCVRHNYYRHEDIYIYKKKEIVHEMETEKLELIFTRTLDIPNSFYIYTRGINKYVTWRLAMKRLHTRENIWKKIWPSANDCTWKGNRTLLYFDALRGRAVQAHRIGRRHII